MEVKAKLQDLRISPRKTRLVVDVIRGLKIEDAFNQLNFINKKVTLALKNLLDSALANALNNFSLEKDNLFIKEIRVDEGRTLKRWMPRARGRATPLRKRTSHVTLILGELVDSGDRQAKKQKIEAPVKLGANIKEEGKARVKDDKDEKSKDVDEKGKKIIDSRSEGRGKHTKIEGKNESSFGKKIFRRKSG